MKWKRAVLLFLVLWPLSLFAQIPLFNTLTLQQFGGITNFNLTLQPQNRFSVVDPASAIQNPLYWANYLDAQGSFLKEPMRTNDFQVLQQLAANQNQVIRVNQFYVSQSPVGVGLTLPATQTETTDSITTPTDDFMFTFGCVESQNLVRTTNLASSQTLTVSYSLPPTGPFFPLQVTPASSTQTPVPELFLLFEGTAPVISTNGTAIETLFIDGVKVSLTNPMRAGRQFELVLATGKTYFINVINSALPLIFSIDLTRTILSATIPFTGLLSFSLSPLPLPTNTFNEFQNNTVSPFLVTNGPMVNQITIDGSLISSNFFNPPPRKPFLPLPAGRSFELLLSNGQTWLIQTAPALPPVLFAINQARTTFRSTIFYTGAVQLASAPSGESIKAADVLTVSTVSILFNPPALVENSPAAAQTILDFNVIGNAYHDIAYNQLTPQITFQGAGVLNKLFVDDVQVPLSTGRPLPRGRKFKLQFLSTLPNRIVETQTWLIYVEDSFTPPFRGNQLGTLGANITSLALELSLGSGGRSLVGSAPFTGFFRVASVQTTPLPNIGPIITRPKVGPFWSTAAETQTFPITPIALYLLYPNQWTTLLDAQITTLIPQKFDVPICATIAELLPILALHDFRRAISYFNQIPASAYSPTQNPFTTYFLMALARNLSADITTYQNTFRPQPSYGIIPSATLTEAAYDANRHNIPIAADIAFQAEAYHWTYTCLNDAQTPLIIFPGYKRLDPAFHTPVAGFAYIDPIKGNLFGVNAVGGLVRFIEGPPPAWYNLGFIPNFLQFNGQDLLILQELFHQLPPPAITATDISTVGEELLELALTATYAVFSFNQVRGLRPYIRALTQPYFDLIKQTLDQFLFTRVNANGIPLSDFFIADLITPGIGSSPGLLSQQQAQVLSIDNGNGIYNLHHAQYGFWLLTIALTMQWDNQFDKLDPWIGQLVTLSDGTVVKRKEIADFLWRDARNPDKDDLSVLPFNRAGNPWEGHSTDNGVLYTPLTTGRAEESLSQDFNGWVGTNQYAKTVLSTPSPTLDAADKLGFDILATFSQTNMELTATAGKLFYHDLNWIYGPPFNVNITVGQQFDTEVTAETTLQPGSPSCILFTPS